MSGPTGQFNIPLSAPLAIGECVYVFDTCSGLVSPVACAFPPAPAPTLSPQLLAGAVAMLSLLGLLGVWRLRRAGAAGR
jgi:hypothetical protein